MAFFNMDRRIINKGRKPWGYVDAKTSAVWTPDQITSLALWLDADDLNTITLDGSNNVEQWDDKSGKERHISQSDSSLRPSYNEIEKRIDFNGSTEYLFRTEAPFFAAGSCVVFGVIDAPAIGTDERWLTEGSSTSLNPVYCFSQSHNSTATRGTTYMRGDTGGTNNAYLDQDDYNFENMWDSGKHINYFQDSGSSLILGRNGVMGSSINYTRQTTTMDRFTIGGLLRDSFVVPMQIQVHEIIILDVVPEKESREEIEGFLAHKWGLAANLPATHPYKDNAP